jgi:hypothetical protein
MTIRTIKIKCDKNSMGVDGRAINVDFCWWFDRQNKQHAFFNWDAATVDLLLGQQEEKAVGYVRTADEGSDQESSGFGPLTDILKITQGRGKAGNVYSCERVGIKHKMAHTLGAAIHNDGQLMDELIDFFHIHRRPIWEGQMLEEPSAHTEPEPPGEDGDNSDDDVDV